MNVLEQLYWTAKAVNWRNLPRRLLQAYRLRSGALRRRLDPEEFTDARFAARCGGDPQRHADLWRQRAAKVSARPDPERLMVVAGEELWHREVLEPAERALTGEYPYFSHWTGATGWPPDFNLDPVNNTRWPQGRHWLDSRTQHPGTDIKLVWEPSRLTLAYCLARAYAVTRDERWADAVWQLCDAWIAQNPPELTVAWECGQEMSFRLMALLTAAAATIDSPAATPQRLYALNRVAWQTGTHVSRNINQALMQGNNHGLSEAAALWTVGLLFPEFPEAERWARLGARFLAHEAARQVADDGSYAQNSLNYHRVMLDDLLWVWALGQRCGRLPPAKVREALGRGVRFVAMLLDDSGRVPNYGANDGTNVLPLSCCDYLDYRPTVQAAWFAVHRRRLLEPGPWDEKTLWLFGSASLESPVEPASRPHDEAARTGGYYVLRGERSWAMTRCHSYRRRPSQADMLHLDLWHGGLNVLRDGGSFSYNCPAPWRHWFNSTAAHNTVQINGQDQMLKGPRFLWFHWTQSRLLAFASSTDGRLGFLAGEHYGYRRLPGRPVHRRMIFRLDDTWVIVDDVLGQGRNEVALRWRLAEGDWHQDGSGWTGQLAAGPFTLAIAAPASFTSTLERGREKPQPEGWKSLYYNVREAAPTIVVQGAADLPLRLVTVVDSAASPRVEVALLGDPGGVVTLKGEHLKPLANEAESLTSGHIELI
ncbi:MAG: alginate lyase family protein [Planctomycetes bacterium]|nr:alginate lyase family protein [Planctomycetota bacterium]